MDDQAYFTEITKLALDHKGTCISLTSLLVLLPNIIALVDPEADGDSLTKEDRKVMAARLRDLEATMKERRLDVTLEDWSLEAHGEKKAKRIVNFKRTNESPEGLHSVFILPVYKSTAWASSALLSSISCGRMWVSLLILIPAGKFDDGDVSTETTAARELQEETGLVWDYTTSLPIARGGHHDRDGGLTNAMGEVLIVPVDAREKQKNALSDDEQAQGLGQVHDFPVELIPEYVDHCLAQGLGITGTISNIALGMKLQRHIQMAGMAPSM